MQATTLCCDLQTIAYGETIVALVEIDFRPFPRRKIGQERVILVGGLLPCAQFRFLLSRDLVEAQFAYRWYRLSPHTMILVLV